MPIFPEAPIRLHVTGMVGGHPFGGMTSVAVNADGLLLVPLDADLQAAGVVRVPFESIDGVAADDTAGGTLHVFLAGGHLVTGTGDARVHGLVAALLHRARAVPELTRAVRALGRGGGDAQEGFFRPLLDAKRRAVKGWSAALDAFDAESLRAALDATLAGMAAAREPERPAARRALQARLCDAAEPLLTALGPLARAATAARGAPPQHALREFRGWVRAVQFTFERADAAWPDVHAVLAASPPDRLRTPAPAPLDRLRTPWNR